MTGSGVNQDELVPRLEKLVDTLQGRRHVHHVVVGASTIDGSWAWLGAAGTADPQGTPMRSDTPWFLASVTKLYIASIVLRLMEQGAIDLDVPIPAYLPPELSRVHVLDGVDHTGEITCRHLLAHATGLPDYLEERPLGGRSLIDEVIENGDQQWTPAEAVADARDQLTPHFPPSDPTRPGSRIRYSDTNFQLLMVIAQQVTGRSMPDLYRQLLFEPLGLAQTWLPGDGVESHPEPAITWLDDWPMVDRPLALRSFGDLYSTLDDVLGFGRALVTGEVFDGPGTVELMRGSFRRFGIPRSMAAIQAPGWPIEYGLGMMRFEPSRLISMGRRVPALFGHTGSTGSWLWHVPSLGILLAGTVDQARGAAIPFRQVPGALLGLR